ncbi:MAG TPA: nucleotidyltransferase domain-containing protein [Thermodesulfobacteriota bacterium]|nr:nucleotidyltransferase domain-containing protein [Thermodesulfobacteriota bacterium]
MPSKTAIEIPSSMWKQYHPFRISSEREVISSADIAEASSIASKIARELVSRFGAKRVFLFGSLTREDFNKRSDIDLAVEGIAPADFYRAVAFASGVSKLWKVDLVDMDDCSESLLDHIKKEGIAL